MIKMNNQGGTVVWGWENYEISIGTDNYIASNQNIYYGNTKVFSRNNGYEYDSSKEDEKKCNDVVKVKKETVVYESAAMNYDQIAVLSEGDIVKRINKEVNVVNGHTWDKVVLSNGKGGYVFSDNVEETQNYTNIEFEHNNKDYNVYFDVSKYNINIKEYPYYFVGVDYDRKDIVICYNTARISINYQTAEHYTNVGQKGFIIRIDSQGKLNVWGWENYYVNIGINDYIASNQNIYYGNTKVFSRNSGYEYDSSKEDEKKCNDVVKVKKETIVYESAAMNYDQIAVLSEGDIVKRINQGVNAINTHIWDKVVLSNGREGYVFADNLEVVKNYTNVEFKYKDKEYNVYFDVSKYNINIKEYPYYLVGVDYDRKDIIIYYNTSRISVDYKTAEYYRNVGKEGFIIRIDNQGKLAVWGRDNYYIKVGINDYISSNQNIYYGNTKVFSRNSGYEYDSSNEDEKKCNDVVKVKKETVVYESAAMNYDQIAVLSEGDIVKRINQGVNAINMHIWDKVVLSNGKEGYVFSDNLEITEEYENIPFSYKDKIYNVYFNPKKYGKSIEEYPYYFIGIDYGTNDIIICYSDSKITIGNENSSYYEIYKGQKGFLVKVKTSGLLEVWNEWGSYGVKIGINDAIAANHDIYKGNTKKLNASIFTQDGSTRFETNINWDDILLNQLTIAAIGQGEMEHDAMPTEKFVLLQTELEIAKTSGYTVSVAISSILPNAASAMRYFLTLGLDGKTNNVYSLEGGIYRKGHTMREINLRTAIEEDSSMKATFNKDIENLKYIAENLCITDGVPITFSNTFETSGEAKDKNNEDWYLAIHYYRVKMQCTAVKKGNSYSMDVRYGLVDYYDWDPNIEKYFENNIQDKLIEVATTHCKLLNIAGLARTYTNFGETDDKVLWSKKYK